MKIDNRTLRVQVSQTLAQMLNRNIGNQLTPELASGINIMMSNQLMQILPDPAPRKAKKVNQGVEVSNDQHE